MTTDLRNAFELRPLFSLIVSGAAILLCAQLAHPQTIKTKEAIERIVVLEKVTVVDGVVNGEVVNRSANTLRDVQLFIRYTWLWDDEMKPGKIDPGTSTFYMLPKEIPAAGRLSFRFEPAPPLPKIAGGHFETSVRIAAFAEVIQQK